VPTASTVGATWTSLATNPDFETGTTGVTYTTASNFFGWQVVSGEWRLETLRDGLAPDSGSAFLTGFEATGTSEIQQIISLEELGVDLTSIDATGCTATFNCRRAQADTALTDTGRVLVEFLDSAQGGISNLYDSGTEVMASEDTWFDRGASGVAVPANTRFIRIRLFATLVSATTADAAFDNITISFTDPVFNNTFAEIYENRYYEVTTAGTTAGSQPVYDTTIGNTTTDGTAVLTARDAWTRHGYVVDYTDNQNFSIDVSEARAVDGWFDGGGLILEGGLNNGVTREVKQWTQTGSLVRLFLQPTFDVRPGQKLRLYPGCDKRLATCRDRFSNVINYRGEPYVPGNDQINRVPDSKR
jgi:hypothetical protein